MLQPRLTECASSKGRMGYLVLAACVALIFSTVSCQDVNVYEENESIEASRIKREGVPENRDLTVLLVNDQRHGEYQSKVGRYHSVKPLIGLLTSTARTFIQDGVTTEFATQILGTTLNNGRIYAQLLTKSSLVLYNKPSNVDDAIVVKPSRSVFDGQWSVKQDLGFIDPEKFVLKNTDYIAPSKMDIVYASNAVSDNIKYWNQPSSPDSFSNNQIFEEPTGRKVQPSNEIPRYVQNEALNFLDGPGIENEKQFVVNPSILNNVNSLHRQSKAYEVTPDSIKVDSRFKEEFNESNIVKVKPDHDLPTFTVKNEFSPVFYYIDNVESRSLSPQAGQQSKSPKRLFGQKSEPRPKKTFTYAGFADFTTIVGDTVIIFTPNSQIVQDPAQVNVFPSAKPVDNFATKITFLASDIPVATATFKAHEQKVATKLATPSFEEKRAEKALYNDEESLKKVLYEVDKVPDVINVQYNNGFGLNLDVIQPSESIVPTIANTRLTDDLQVIPIDGVNSRPTDPLNTLKPSATILESFKESVVTESEENDMYTNSEEEMENTAAEVTEKEDEEETTLSGVSEEVGTTTESGHSEETFEDFEVTTEGKQDTPDSGDVICTKGFETKSTMTTAYKTLTYLTTYFIPLEGTETTTSIKSDVVVESNVGYLTNVVCKTDLQIEPTAVVSIEVKSSIQSSLEQPDIVSEPALTEYSVKSSEEIVTEALPKTTPVDNVTVEDFEIVERIKEEADSKQSSTTRTTTESVNTSQSHVEVSVSTEHYTTPTEKPLSEENISEIDPSENEIDLIYKTLYTTYTYFTTFFGDATSSVASHKSVVTNIITSTVKLSQLDPSLLGAFNEDEIAPTSVGIGRPTEAINSIIDLVKNKDVIESVQNDDVYRSRIPTPTLDDDLININPDAVKTYFTTYTFFTTIYVGNDANVCSRSEVYTNYVGPDELIPTKINPLAESSKVQFDFRNCKQVKSAEPPKNSEENSSIETSISMEQNENNKLTDLTNQSKKDSSPNPSPVEVDMLFSVESNPLEDTSYVTDVKSSSSKGEQQLLEHNMVLEDQISSESNIEEIMPSPTLLLQTSYTTFTYFTTIYIGKESSKIKSRLETITNVVTETITPKKEPEVEESNLPITYYTTFTYWTTLYKDKSTTITSREEIVSNVVHPSAIVEPIPSIVNPIDTTPIDVDSELPPKNLEVELKPSLISDSLEQDDGKATFYTTYTYFTTFYVGNTSQIRSSLETVTNIVDNSKLVDDNQLGRKIINGPADKNLIQDNGEKPKISPSAVKEEILPTKLPDLSSAAPTVLLGTYIDNLFAEVKQGDSSTPKPEDEKKILYSQVAVISGDSLVVTSDNRTLMADLEFSSATPGNTSTEGTTVSSSPEVIQSSIADSETTTEGVQEPDEDDDSSNSRKPGRLTFTSKKPTFTPVIRPFASRNRPTFSPKRVPLLSGATIITRSDFTPTITATPTLKSVRSSGFGGNRKQSAFPGSSSSRRFSGGRNSAANPSSNLPVASRSGGFARASIQPTARRSGFRSGSVRGSSLDFASRSAAAPRIRPTASSKLRGSRQSSSRLPPEYQDQEYQHESETSVTLQEENPTEQEEEVTEAPVKTTNNPLLRFRRPPLGRQPGAAVTPRSTTQTTTRKTSSSPRSRLTTTTRRPTNRPTTNPLLSLRRQRPNALFPRRNLFKQPEPEPEEEIKENEQNVDDQNEEVEEGEDLDVDNDYDSSDRKEQQVSTPSTPAPKKPSNVQIRPFRRRAKRQVDYGNRNKYNNFRRPGAKAITPSTRRSDPEPETEAPTTAKPRANKNRFSSRLTSNARTTTSASITRSSARQPFIVRGESRTTTTSAPSYRRSRPNTRTTTSSSRLKAPRLSSFNSQTTSRSSSKPRSRGRTTTSRTNSRQRNSFESNSGERINNYNHLVNDGKITVTYQIPIEVSIPVINGKNTEYKQVLTAKPSLQTLLQNQVSTSLGPLGNQVLVLTNEATEIAENGVTKIIKFILHETPTSTVVFTPTTIRGRKTSYSHILPSTVYNVEPLTSTLTPEISSNVPLANLLLSQLLLGNQQPGINPLLALQGQGLLPQQQQLPLVPTPITEYKTRTSTYVTTITDNRETVLSITFKGIPILTTIKDPVKSVITATEYITDTIVSTPTVFQQSQPQFNSLLLPLLLQQQQQQQQQQILASPNPLLGLQQPDLNLVQNNLLNNDIFNSQKQNLLADLNSNDNYEDSQDLEQESAEEIPVPPPTSPRSHRKHFKPAKPSPPQITSVVTLYVSGRHPGEFSTVLSTVISDDTQIVRKREAIYFDEIKLSPSLLPNINELSSSQSDDILDISVLSNLEKYQEEPDESKLETQSLESIVGEVSKHIKYDASPTISYVVKLATPSANKSISEQKQSSVNDIS